MALSSSSQRREHDSQVEIKSDRHKEKTKKKTDENVEDNDF